MWIGETPSQASRHGSNGQGDPENLDQTKGDAKEKASTSQTSPADGCAEGYLGEIVGCSPISTTRRPSPLSMHTLLMGLDTIKHRGRPPPASIAWRHEGLSTCNGYARKDIGAEQQASLSCQRSKDPPQVALLLTCCSLWKHFQTTVLSCALSLDLLLFPFPACSTRSPGYPSSALCSTHFTMLNPDSTKSDIVAGAEAPEDDAFEMRSTSKKNGSPADIQDMKVLGRTQQLNVWRWLRWPSMFRSR